MLNTSIYLSTSVLFRVGSCTSWLDRLIGIFCLYQYIPIFILLSANQISVSVLVLAVEGIEGGLNRASRTVGPFLAHFYRILDKWA